MFFREELQIKETSKIDSLGRPRTKRLYLLHCQQCRSPYYRIKALLQTSKFCSSQCKGESLRTYRTTAHCPTCNEIFLITKDNRKFCSISCYRNARSFKICRVCEKQFRAYHTEQAGIFCSIECKNIGQRGPGNPNYKGAAAIWFRYGSAWSIIRQRVLERDNNQCQRCNAVEVKFHVHHKIPYRICRAHDPGNLVTLCASCHHTVEVGLPFEHRPSGDSYSAKIIGECASA